MDITKKVEIRQGPETEDQNSGKVPDEPSSEPSGFFSFLKSPLVTSLVVLALSIFFIFVLNQVLSFIQAIESAPLPVRIAGWIAFALLGIALIFSCIRLVWSFSRLRTNPGITLDVSSNLWKARKIWNRPGHDPKKIEALLQIIRSYPKDDSQGRLLKRGNLDLTEFKKCLNFLVEGGNDIPRGNDWLKECQGRYVEPLKKCAHQLIHDYALRVGLKTALVKNGMLDSLIIWINAILMFEELCMVFNVRTNRINSVYMVGRLALATVISAKSNDFVDEAANHLMKEGQNNIAEVLAGMAAKFFVKGAAEATVNYFIFQRLGRAAVAALLPVQTR